MQWSLDLDIVTLHDKFVDASLAGDEEGSTTAMDALKKKVPEVCE